MSSYYSELTRAMALLGEHERSIFIGQAVSYPGTGMTKSFEGVPREKLWELPVFEETQMGMAIGLAMGGLLPVCVYPRWNFLLAATNQLVNHLDKISLFSDYRPKVIIRVAAPTAKPLHPGPQHLGDFSRAMRSLLTTTWVVQLEKADQIVPEYQKAVDRTDDQSTILVEYASLYNDA